MIKYKYNLFVDLVNYLSWLSLSWVASEYFGSLLIAGHALKHCCFWTSKNSTLFLLIMFEGHTSLWRWNWSGDPRNITLTMGQGTLKSLPQHWHTDWRKTTGTISHTLTECTLNQDTLTQGTLRSHWDSVLSLDGRLLTPSTSSPHYPSWITAYSLDNTYTKQCSAIYCTSNLQFRSHVLQCSAVQCSAVQCSAVQCSSSYCNWSTVQHSSFNCLIDSMCSKLQRLCIAV